MDEQLFFEEEDNSVATLVDQESDVASLSSDENILDKGEKHYKQSLLRKKTSLNTLFSRKEVLDRIGYGFASHQFITILFFLAGGSTFFVGLLFALKNVFSGLFASFINYYNRHTIVNNRVISTAGIIFGFSFVGILLALRLDNLWLFALFIIIGSVGVVAYGELYGSLLNNSIKYERRSRFLRHITLNGIFITILSFILSGLLLDHLGFQGKILHLFGLHIHLTGYFVSFEIAAVALIISGFVLSKIPSQKKDVIAIPFKELLLSYIHELYSQIKLFFSNRYLALLFVGSLSIAIIETLGATYYGYYIFTLFQETRLGGFFSVAIIFSVAILVSFLGSTITHYLRRRIGLAPLFVFGTLLLAILPLILAFNHYFFPILVAVSFNVIGANILAVAQGLVSRKLLHVSERKKFFESLGVLLVIPFLVFVPLGALLAQFTSFEVLFVVLAFILVFVVVPLYFYLVIMANKKRL